MAVAVTNTTVTFNTAVAITKSAATSSVIDTAEVFTITPTKAVTTGADYKGVIIINNTATDQGTITYSIADGELWAATGAATGSVAQGVSSVIEIEGGKLNQADGTILLTLTPASGKRLLTDHAATVSYIQTK